MALDGAVRQAFEQVLSPADVMTDPVRAAPTSATGSPATASPGAGGAPGDTEQVAAVVRLCAEHGVPFVARGAGTGLSGGALPVADGVRDRPVADATRSSRSTRDRRAVVEPGVINLGDHPGGRAARALLRARPVEPAGLHDRRQRRRELRRRALPQVRLHRQPRARRSRSCSRRRAGRRSAATTGEQARLRPARRRSSAPRARSASSPRSRCGCCASPRRCGPLLAAFPSIDAAGDAVSATSSPPGIVPAAIEMMDALAIEAAEAAVHAGYTAGAGAVLIVELDGPPTESTRSSSRSSAICGEHGATRAPRRRDRRRAGADLEGPQGGVRRDGPDQPDYIVQDGVDPAHRARRGARPDRRAGRRGRPAGRQRLPRRRRQPAPACSTTTPCRARRARPRSWPAAIVELCVAHGRLASPASTASAPTRPATMPKMFTDADLATMQRVRCGVRPGRAVQPGQGVPDAAAVRRAPGPVPAAPVEAGRRDRAAVDAPRPTTRPSARPTRHGDARRRRRDVRGRRLTRRAARRPLAGAGTAAELGRAASAPGRGARHRRARPASSTTTAVDMTVVGAGRARRCRAAGRRWPRTASALSLDAARVARGATIGGLLATGDAGPRRLRYGSLRDLVIGVTLVLRRRHDREGGGHVDQERRRLRPGQALHGSLGTLGVVAEVVLRLHPLPKAAGTRRVAVRAGRAAEVGASGARQPVEPGAGVDRRPRPLLLRLRGLRERRGAPAPSGCASARRGAAARGRRAGAATRGPPRRAGAHPRRAGMPAVLRVGVRAGCRAAGAVARLAAARPHGGRAGLRARGVATGAPRPRRGRRRRARAPSHAGGVAPRCCAPRPDRVRTLPAWGRPPPVAVAVLRDGSSAPSIPTTPSGPGRFVAGLSMPTSCRRRRRFDDHRPPRAS